MAKNAKKTYLILGLLFLIIFISAYHSRGIISDFLSREEGSQPTHVATEGCNWNKRVFAQLSLFQQKCPNIPNQSLLSENQDGTKVQTEKFALQIFPKDPLQKPLDTVREWYTKLTPEEQRVCEIQDADEPFQFFTDGRLMVTEDPHPTPHKTRYKIYIKPDIEKEIVDKYGGYLVDGHDYMCGHLVGTTWSGHPPYFEFDDRNPGKYLFVGSYGFDGPPIDLNSIRF